MGPDTDLFGQVMYGGDLKVRISYPGPTFKKSKSRQFCVEFANFVLLVLSCYP